MQFARYRKTVWKKYGADVDDSVNYRVYNNFGADKRTNKAVQDTKVRSYARMENRSRLIIFLHQQAGQAQMRYGGADRSAAYLKSVECDFDQNMPWSSWSVEIPWETLEKRSGNLEGSGKFIGLRVIKKNISGAVTGMEIVTENKKYTAGRRI